MALTILCSLLLLGILFAVFYFSAVEPSRSVERWIASLVSGEQLPDKPNFKGRFWLASIYRELQGTQQRFREFQAKLDANEESQAHIEFLYNCVLATMLEGVMVVDSQYRITLVNSECMNIFQLTQSPVNSELGKAFAGTRVESLVGEAFEKKAVQAEIMRRKYNDESGRPPTYEVRAVPILLNGEVNSVIVLFLPPANRVRMIQTLKWHSQKLNNLVNELLVSSQTKHRLPQAEVMEIDPRVLLEEIRDAFLARPDNKGVRLALKISGDVPAFRADKAQLQAALLQLLENTLFYSEDKPKILFSASSGEDGVRLSIEVEGAMFPAQEVALLTAAESDSQPEDTGSHVLGDTSGFLSIREALEAQAGNFFMEAERQKKQVAFTVHFQSKPKEGDSGPPAVAEE